MGPEHSSTCCEQRDSSRGNFQCVFVCFVDCLRIDVPVATVRSEKGLPPLETFVIDVISAVSADLGTEDAEALKNAKMSSTYIRQWIYEQRIGTTGSDMARSGKV